MKIDELLKLLENVKINDNKINEKHEIAEYLAQTFGDDKVLRPIENIMMKDRKIYGYNEYVDLFRSNRISPNDAYVYVNSYNCTGTYSVHYLYPFLTDKFLLTNTYLSKLGFGPSNYGSYAPARGLKYVASANMFTDAGRVVVEVADLDTITINMKLSAPINRVLSTKDNNKIGEITSIILSQELFAGHNLIEAGKIIHKYYKDNDTSLTKEVMAIRDAYNHIFQPYRLVYDIKTKRLILTYPRSPIESTLNNPSPMFNKNDKNLKIGDSSKHLENVEIDERRKIAEYLAQILSDDSLHTNYYIMTKDKKIYNIPSYKTLFKTSPDDAYAYVLIGNVYHLASYYFPFLVDSYLLLYSYLSKLGFEYYNIVPATGLKYISLAIRYLDINHVVVEIADLNNVVTNMNLPTLIHNMLGTKYIDDYKVEEIISQLESQKLFTEYSFNAAWDLSSWHYDHGDKTMPIIKKIEAIRDAYNRIFQPYRVVYDIKTKQIQVSEKNERPTLERGGGQNSQLLQPPL
jgi:hypothetical protein